MLGTSDNSNLFFEYHRIGIDAYRDKVRFYEENKSRFLSLGYDEQIDIKLDYLICLFEIGKYNKFLSKVDQMIETVIIENIFEYGGINIFNDLLFKKAACLYNTGRYIKAEAVIKSYIKIENTDETGRMLYGRCIRQKKDKGYNKRKTLSLVLIFSALLISIIDVLLIRSFYPQFTNFFLYVRMATFTSGFGFAIFNEVYLRYIIAKGIDFKISHKNIMEFLRL